MSKRLPKQTPPTEPTRGPWRWYGNTKNEDIYLAAPWGGRHLVMSFTRWGMSGAQPCFYADGLRHGIGHFVQYEKYYRDDVIGIDHPDARLIAAAPELLAALELMESVYRQNVVAVGEPSSVLEAAQAAIRSARGIPAQSVEQPRTVDAVDPSVTHQESGPRA